MILFFLAACPEPGPTNGETPNVGSDLPEHIPGDIDEDPTNIPGDTDTAEPIDTSPDTDTDTGAEDGHSYSEADFLFGVDMVHTVDLTISDAGIKSLKRDYKTYVEAAVVIDGEAVDSVGVRLKGSGSYQTLDGKAAFKIDFNRFVDDQEFHGLPKMTLNNMTHDDAQVHELLSYKVFDMAGLPHNRVGYAWVTVNGEDYGLYSHVEMPCKGWMERNFDTRDGREYEGGYPRYPESYDHADFKASEAGNFDLEIGEDVANADVIAAADEVGAGGDDWDTRVDEVIDLDEYAAFQIGEAWVGQWDGYAFASASNNYRIFVDAEGDGRIRFLPSGFDWTFYDYGNWGRSGSPVGRKCAQSTECAARLAAAAADFADKVDEDELEALHQEAWALIEPYVEADPRKVTNYNTIKRNQASVTSWIDGRSAEILELYTE